MSKTEKYEVVTDILKSAQIRQKFEPHIDSVAACLDRLIWKAETANGRPLEACDFSFKVEAQLSDTNLQKSLRVVLARAPDSVGDEHTLAMYFIPEDLIQKNIHVGDDIQTSVRALTDFGLSLLISELCNSIPMEECLTFTPRIVHIPNKFTAK